MARPQLKISVPQPCSESWAEMTPQAQGRFCASCTTTVVDFSKLTDKQLLEYFTRQSGKTCGRFSATQLNRAVYTEALPKQNFFPRAVAAVALFLGISSQTQGQNIPDQPIPSSYIENSKNAAAEKTVAKTPEKLKGDSLVISGRLIDAETNEPISFGNVLIKNSKFYSMTDLEGRFKLVVPDTFNLGEFILFAPNIGFETSETLVSIKEINKPVDILLNKHFLSGLSVIEICEVRKTPGHYFRSFWWRTKNLFRKND